MSSGVSTSRTITVNTTMAHPQAPTQLLIQFRKLYSRSVIPNIPVYSLLSVVFGSSGTGSYPPLLKGLHRIILQAAILPPFRAP